MSELLREEEIRPSDLMEEQARRYAADVAWLLERRNRFVDVVCPACGDTRQTPRWTKYGMRFVACAGCATVYISPRPDAGLLAEYSQVSQNYVYWSETIFPRSEEARRAKIFAPRARRVADLVERHTPGASVLVDVGAGFGTFCEESGRIGIFERVVAVEPQPNLAEVCRRKGLEVVESPVEDVFDVLGAVDVVTSFEVIEHLFEPEEFVRGCRRLLGEDGLLVLTCPNVRGFDVVVLQERAGVVDAEHLNYFHPASLQLLLERCGFEVVSTLTPGELDAELVRARILDGTLDVSDQPFLERVLVDDWDRVGAAFQRFLSSNQLSSNMWLVARPAR